MLRSAWLGVLLLAAGVACPAASQRLPWKPGDPPPAAGPVTLGQTLAQLDSILGRPTTVTRPRPGRESRVYEDHGISLIADSTAGVVWVALFSSGAGDLGDVRVGDPRERAEERFGEPTKGRGESKVHTFGDWSVGVQLDPTSEFVYGLSVGGTEFYPDAAFGVLTTLKQVVQELYDAGESAGLLVFVSWANFFLWRKYRFWVPKYVHVLAVLAFLVICWLNWLWIRAGGELTVRRVIIILLFPAIVYFFFVGVGGAKAARARRSDG